MKIGSVIHTRQYCGCGTTYCIKPAALKSDTQIWARSVPRGEWPLPGVRREGQSDPGPLVERVWHQDPLQVVAAAVHVGGQAVPYQRVPRQPEIHGVLQFNSCNRNSSWGKSSLRPRTGATDWASVCFNFSHMSLWPRPALFPLGWNISQF